MPNVKTKRRKRGTDWRTKEYEKPLWQKALKWRKSDEQAYFDYFKPRIEEVAVKMVRDYRLPDSCLDDLMSDGLLALARIPKENRWSGKYVFTAIVNRMRDGLSQAKTRWSRFELWAEVPDTLHAPDGIDGRIAIRQMVSMLEGFESQVVELHLQGFETKEIAVKLGVQPAAVKCAWDSAAANIRQRINPTEETQTCQPISTDR